MKYFWCNELKYFQVLPPSFISSSPHDQDNANNNKISSNEIKRELVILLHTGCFKNAPFKALVKWVMRSEHSLTGKNEILRFFNCLVIFFGEIAISISIQEENDGRVKLSLRSVFLLKT